MPGQEDEMNDQKTNTEADGSGVPGQKQQTPDREPLSVAPWWKCLNRVYQANNHEIDPTKIHGSQIADEAERLNCNVVIADAGGGISTFYPTRIPHLARNPYLAEGRDFFGEIAAACKAKGLRLFARNDYGRMPRAVAEVHPEWARFGWDSEFQGVYDVVTTCPTGDMFLKIPVEAFHEQFIRYDMDGIYINALGGRCCCARCRQLFEAETAQRFPVCPDWNDPAYRAYIEWGYRVVDRLARTQCEGVKAWRPDKLYFIDVADFQEPEWIHGSAQDLVTLTQYQDMVSSESFNDIPKRYPDYLAPVVARFIGHVARWRGKRGYQFISSFPGHSFPNSNQPEDTFKAWMKTVPLQGVSPIMPWYGFLNDDDQRLIGPAADAFKFVREHQELLSAAIPHAPVAVVWSRRTMDHYGRGQARERYSNRFFATCQALLEEHLLFTVIPDDLLADGELDFKALVLPNTACLNDAACRNVDRFVEAGGGLLATFETALYDEHGEPRADFGLKSLGVTKTGDVVPFPEDWHQSHYHSYFLLEQTGATLLAGFEGTNILPFKGALVPVRPVAADATMPFAHMPPHPAQPPEKGWIRETGPLLPAVVSRSQRVVYFACEVDEMFARYRMPDHRRLIANAARSVHQPVLTTNAPPVVEVTLSRLPDGEWLLGLVNHSGARLGCPALPILDLRFSLQLPGGAEKDIKLDRLGEFEMIHLGKE
jgi:hypothetical protein